MKSHRHYLPRAYSVRQEDIDARTPELLPLNGKVVTIFGLGSIGAPSALELARAGVGELRLVDYDYVDPAACRRWPVGLRAAGWRKTDVIQGLVQEEYPWTRVRTLGLRLGRIRDPRTDNQSDQEHLYELLKNCDLVFDATGELGVTHLLSDETRERNLPFIGVSGTLGGWGGRVFRILPGHTEGCWFCYRLRCDPKHTDDSIPDPPSNPNEEEDKDKIQPIGCADPTFTGAGFDMFQIALMGVRTTVSTLCGGEPGGYPAMSWDAVHIAFRDQEGNLIPPQFNPFHIMKHPSCPICRNT